MLEKDRGCDYVLQKVQSWLYVSGIKDNPPVTLVGVT